MVSSVPDGLAGERHARLSFLRPPASSRLVLAAGVLSAGGALALALAEATGHQIDFDIYRMGAQHVLGTQLYQVRLQRALMGGSRGMLFTYPPFSALLFAPFTLLSVRTGQLVWSALLIAALYGVAALSVRAARPLWSRQAVLGCAAIVLFPVLRLNPDALTLDYGQVNYFLVLLVLADLTCVLRIRQHTLPRGILVGIAAAVKLTPLIFIPYLVLTRQLRAACFATGTFLVCLLGTFAIAPHSSWLYWSTEISDDKRSGNLLYISDQNLHSFLQRVLGGPPSPVLWALLTVVIGCFGLAVAAWAHRKSSPMLGMLVCATTGLIISPVSWVHHYVWVVPVLAWLALAADRPRSGLPWAGMLAILCWVAPVWWVPDPQQGYGGVAVLLEGNSFFLAAVLFLLLVPVMLVIRTRSDRSRPLAAGASPAPLQDPQTAS